MVKTKSLNLNLKFDINSTFMTNYFFPCFESAGDGVLS
jgi:hypothetical protein